VGEKIYLSLTFENAWITCYSGNGVGINQPADSLDVRRVKNKFNDKNSLWRAGELRNLKKGVEDAPTPLNR
jgi:hypothetical protein